MNFLRDKPLKQLGIYCILLFLLIYGVEYGVVSYRINRMDESERKIDFARSLQVRHQALALQAQRFQEGEQSLATDITVGIEDQDHGLKILADGGRVDGTDIFLRPLSRLPRITYDNLTEHWRQYRAGLIGMLSQKAKNVVTTITTDSTGTRQANNTLVSNAAYDKALAAATKWQIVSNGYSNLIADLEEEVTSKRAAINAWRVFFIVFDVLTLAGLYFVFYRFVLNPIQIIRSNTTRHNHTIGLPPNEIGHLSLEMNGTLENLRDATEFVSAIGEGNLDIDYKEAFDHNYTPGKNRLADSLIAMQNKLKSLNLEEKKRQWANEGLTRFVDILRTSDDNITILGDHIISNLVKYTNSNQGALYLLNDENEYDKHLELISLFAFDIKKFEARTIKLGEGILGQTFLEKETTYLTDFPEEYIRITSGLGDANPRSILIVPLKVDRDVYGLVELASFHPYQQHEIEFVERLGETIASTLATVKGAQKNRHLIEQFQEQTEMMKSQEEEMRQNMEELQATQEEVSRKERSYISRIQELESADHSGTVAAAVDTERKRFAEKERSYQDRITALEQQLSALQNKQPDGWEVAEQFEKTLQVNLEALRITQEALSRNA